jgi:hypothetical protein
MHAIGSGMTQWDYAAKAGKGRGVIEPRWQAATVSAASHDIMADCVTVGQSFPRFTPPPAGSGALSSPASCRKDGQPAPTCEQLRCLWLRDRELLQPMEPRPPPRTATGATSVISIHGPLRLC